MLPWKLGKRHILHVNQNLSLVYFLLAKFQLVSCNLSLALIWQMTYTHKLPKLCSVALKGLCHQLHVLVCLKSQLHAKQICLPSNVVNNKNELWKTNCWANKFSKNHNCNPFWSSLSLFSRASFCICIFNSMICSDIWHKYQSDISKLLYLIWDNFEISLVVFMPNITYKSCYSLFILLPTKGF